jgi:hypothetical protein
VLVVGVIGLAAGAQGLINSMLKGDQGLSNFLSDGQGFSGSGYKPLNERTAGRRPDPLPWLKLPKLDFVEVAGQENDGNPFGSRADATASLQFPVGSEAEKVFLARLETMAAEVRQCLRDGNISRADELRKEIETLCAGTGIAYQTNDEDEVPRGDVGK